MKFGANCKAELEGKIDGKLATKNPPHLFRVARLQNEIAPVKNLIRHEKWFEKRENKIRKTTRNVTENY